MPTMFKVDCSFVVQACHVPPLYITLSSFWGEPPEQYYGHGGQTKEPGQCVASVTNAICRMLSDTNMVWVAHWIGDGRLVRNVLGRG